jgi:hypothetical protein
MEIKKFNTYLNEAIDLDEIYENIGESFTELKKDLIDLINNTLESSDIKNVSKEDLNDFITNYITAGKNVDMIDELVEDNDIFNFYLKHQSDFDELLNDTGYMSKSPEENGVFSLYDVIIDGTKQGIMNLMEIIQSDIFSN